MDFSFRVMFGSLELTEGVMGKKITGAYSIGTALPYQ